MDARLPYQLLADAVLVLHLGIVLFVVGAFVAIVAGNLRGWRWVNRTGFRLLHLGAIALVVVQSWTGTTCPLTALESWLRARAGTAVYAEGFIEHWVQWLLFYDAPTWLFTLVYTLFGLLVAAAWWYFPPESRRRRGERS